MGKRARANTPSATSSGSKSSTPQWKRLRARPAPISNNCSKSKGPLQDEAKQLPKAKPQTNSMVAQAKPKPTVAPTLSSPSGAASSSKHEVLGDAEESADYAEPAESLDDWVQRDCWAKPCGYLDLRFTQ